MADVTVLFTQLTEILTEIRRLGVAENLLHWDMETKMPPEGAAERVKTLGFLAGEMHDRMVSEQYGLMLTQLKDELDAGNLDELQSATVRQAWRDYERETCLPGEFVRDLAEAKANSQHAWEAGKKDNDSSEFLKDFPRLVELKREEARLLVKPGQSLYDALHEEFEPGMTLERLQQVFEPLVEFFSGMVTQVAVAKKKPRWRKYVAPIAKQEAIGQTILQALGYNLNAGRLDISTHPFTCDIHPGDVRITTRYDERDLLNALGSTIHEAGHGMYEQGLPPELFGLPVGRVPSYGIHESQSRLWEKQVGQSRQFIDFLYNRVLPEHSKKLRCGVDALYRSYNVIQPSLIRVDADEVTYNLHIYIRLLIESQLIDGSLQVDQLPDAWNELMMKYLGLEVPNDYAGYLQDVHWPCGYFGYFPTYTIGNLYSAQLFDAALNDIPNLEDGFARGEFAPLLEWLRKKVHSVAGLHSADDIIRQATGSGLTANNWMDYIECKYGEIYGL